MDSVDIQTVNNYSSTPSVLESKAQNKGWESRKSKGKPAFYSQRCCKLQLVSPKLLNGKTNNRPRDYNIFEKSAAMTHAMANGTWEDGRLETKETKLWGPLENTSSPWQLTITIF